jgi:transcriptional regulator with XRE-family HTH domain
MDKRQLAAAFRDRLRQLLEEEQGTAAFLRDTGIDRSALSQFLDPGSDRMPRAEALRRIAAARGVTTDWLLSLTNARQGVPEVATAVQIETATLPGGGSPLDAWRREAAGTKLRYVPAHMPDMPHAGVPEDGPGEALPGEAILGGFRLGEMDVEIAMPVQTLEDYAAGTGLWADRPRDVRRAHLARMAATVERAYPALRLHLYDGARVFAAPFTVFGRFRAAVYLGDVYLVVTAAEQVDAMIGLFDSLVRRADVGPDRAHLALAGLAGRST